VSAVRAAQLSAAFELGRRSSRTGRKAVDGQAPRDVGERLVPQMATGAEELRVVLLNTRNAYCQ